MMKHKQAVHLEVTDLDLNVNYYLTCIYGSNAYQERKELWALIKNWSTNIAKPWALFGDFNACKELSEKEGGTLLQPREVRDLCNCLIEANLFDIQATGCYLTWSNRSEDINRRTFKKLDRCVVNDEWVTAFDQSFANFIPQLVSDHSAIVVHWKACLQNSVKPFKFFNHWTSHVEIASLVEQTWAERVLGNPMMRVTSKLKILKNKVKPWNKLHFSNLKDKISEAKHNLERIQLEIQARPLDLLLAGLEKKAMKDYREVIEAEAASLRQKAKVDKSQHGDQNTAYFHRIVKAWFSRNRILSLTTESGILLTEENDMAREAVGYFVNLVGTRSDNCYGEGLENFSFDFTSLLPEDSEFL
ncbi:Dnase i-like superfamily protein [Thalictrum thalictroides]|uniref:Dnase i-like superfamily protein n=1 Tax=Thalictrum thalictroides TaxID=46969 RepID=A0A7J6VYY2_THATH|nr:Dnase i-like superfamily protein [Thalictrum thalictroides]